MPRSDGEVVVSNLRDALNRIIHAQKLVVGFEQLPPQVFQIYKTSVYRRSVRMPDVAED